MKLPGPLPRGPFDFLVQVGCVCFANTEIANISWFNTSLDSRESSGSGISNDIECSGEMRNLLVGVMGFDVELQEGAKVSIFERTGMPMSLPILRVFSK